MMAALFSVEMLYNRIVSCNIGTAWFWTEFNQYWTDSSWITTFLPIVELPVLELIDYLHTIIDLNWGK